jgi:diacylglycerol kinase family enzyme
MTVGQNNSSEQIVDPAVTIASFAPLYIVLNAGSGPDESSVTQTIIEGVLTSAGREYHIIRLDDTQQLKTTIARAVELASANAGVVVASGGDGTINAVAQQVLASGCAFGVLPQGTFNYFSRSHGIPSDTAEATRLLLTARAHPVQVGLVNERVFLVNASLGLYPQLLEDREAWKSKLGRSRLVAFGAGLMTLLREHRRLQLHFEYRGLAHDVLTPTLFVGNNRLQMEQIGTAYVFEEGQLAGIMLRPVRLPGMLWLLLRGALASLGEADNVVAFGFDSLIVRPSRRRSSHRIKVATDGEVDWLETPLSFRVSPEPLLLLKPEPEVGEAHVM